MDRSLELKIDRIENQGWERAMEIGIGKCE